MSKIPSDLLNTIDLQPRTFSTQEVTAITGVSAAAMSNWGQRGYVPKRPSVGWPRYPVEDVALVYLLGLATDAGFPVSRAHYLAERGYSTVLALLENAPGAIAGWDDLPEHRQRKVKKMPRPDADELFLVAVNGPEVEGEHPTRFLVQRGEVRHLDDIFAGRDAELAVVLDLWSIANRIIERAGLPLFEIATDTDAGSA